MEIDSARFFRVYPNLPMFERSNVCCVVDDEPISWHVAYVEITNKTELSKKILKILDKLKLI